jgi:hypothetical protein
VIHQLNFVHKAKQEGAKPKKPIKTFPVKDALTKRHNEPILASAFPKPAVDAPTSAPPPAPPAATPAKK